MDKIFEQNPSLDIYYKTSDGSAFLLPSDATNHAKGLKDQKVEPLTRPKTKIVEEKSQIFVQTGENPDGSPKVEYKPIEISVNTLTPSAEDLATEMAKTNPDVVKSKVQEILQKGVEASDITKDVSKAEVKLTPKQQTQADYKEKFGEVPAEEFTINELLEAIEKGEKLVAEIKND